MLIDKLFVIAEVTTHVVLYVLIGLSVLSIGTIVERWWYYFRRRVDFAELSTAVTRLLRGGDHVAAQHRLGQTKAPEAQIIREALEWYPDGPDAFSQIVEKCIRERRKELDGGLLFLGTLGNNAPFIGLFGTVLGIVTAFRGLSNTTNSAAMGNVMSAIAEALIATAIGILVAIPAVVAYNILDKRSSQVADNAQSLANIAVATMHARSHNRRLVAVQSGENEDAPAGSRSRDQAVIGA